MFLFGLSFFGISRVKFQEGLHGVPNGMIFTIQPTLRRKKKTRVAHLRMAMSSHSQDFVASRVLQLASGGIFGGDRGEIPMG